MTARTPPEELYLRTVDEAARETKRIALLDAAAQCFAERGYNATRTADICSAAGMSSGNLFHYFPTKHAVLLAVVERDGAETAAAIAGLTTAADPFAALLSLLDEICRLAADATYSGWHSRSRRSHTATRTSRCGSRPTI